MSNNVHRSALFSLVRRVRLNLSPVELLDLADFHDLLIGSLSNALLLEGVGPP